MAGLGLMEDGMPKLEGEKILSLLKLEVKKGPVFFVIEDEYGEHEDGPLQGDKAYQYEEHSCPTNWLRHCVAVIEDGDEDPHGFLEHVRSVRVPDTCDPSCEDGWISLFPEVHAAPSIDGSAVDITDQNALPAPSGSDGPPDYER